MFIQSIGLKNFRSYSEGLQLNNLNRVNVIIGPNGAGKSNLIIALYLLNQLTRNDYTTKDIQELAFDYDTNRKISLELVLIPSSQERLQASNRFLIVNPKLGTLNTDKNFTKLKYLIEIQGQNIVEEKLSVLNTSGKFVDFIIHKMENGVFNQYVIDLKGLLSRIESLSELDDAKIIKKESKWLQTLLILHSQDTTFLEYEIAGMIRSSFMKFHWYFPSRSIDHKISGADETFLVGNGSNIKRLIKTLHDKDFSTFYSLYNKVNDILGLEKIEFNDSTNVIGISYKVEGLNSKFDLSTLGHGQQQLLILLGALEILQSDNVYLIEEPEVHIHSASQKKLFQLLIEKCEDSQFFITTHSPNFTIVDRRVNTYLVTKSEGQSIISLLDNEEQIKFIKGQMGIDHSDAFLSKFVVFVEGVSEIVALRKLGEASAYSRLKYSTPILPYGGESKFRSLTQFTGFIHKLGNIPIIIADGNEKIRNEIENLERATRLFKILRPENEQFEDQFDSQLIAKAMNKLYSIDPFRFGMTIDELESQRKGKSVANILDDYLSTKYGIHLEKKKLAEVLAGLIVQEINSQQSREKQRFEVEADKVLKYMANIT